MVDRRESGQVGEGKVAMEDGKVGIKGGGRRRGKEGMVRDRKKKRQNRGCDRVKRRVRRGERQWEIVEEKDED